MVKKELKILIGKNKTKKVIEKLLSLTEVVNDNDELYDEAILISARYENYITGKRAGVLNYSEEQIQINRINNSLLEIIQRIPDSIVELNPNKPLKKGDEIVELLINEDFEDFNSTRKENLVGVISAILNIQRQDVIIRQIVRGSVKISIELSKEKALDLMNIFKLGVESIILQEALNIKSISLKDLPFGFPFLNIGGQFIGAMGIGIGLAIGVFIFKTEYDKRLYNFSLTVNIKFKENEPEIAGNVVLEYSDTVSPPPKFTGVLRFTPSYINNFTYRFDSLPQYLLGKNLDLYFVSTDYDNDNKMLASKRFVFEDQKVMDFPISILFHLYGVIRDRNGKPLDNVKITLGSTVTFTDSLGKFDTLILDRPNFYPILTVFEKDGHTSLSTYLINDGKYIEIILDKK